MIRLFDNRERTDMVPSTYAEPDYTFLERSGRTDSARVRSCLESWFQALPGSRKAGFAGAFRTPLDTQFTASVYELYLHELLRRRGCELEIHPDNPSGKTSRPDFRVVEPDQSVMFLEAVFASDISDPDRAAEARKNVVYDCLNSIDSPDFFLGMIMRGDPKTPPPAKRMRAEVAAWISTLSWDDLSSESAVDGSDRPHYQFDHDGWSIEFLAHAKSEANRGKPDVRPVGIRSSGVQKSTHVDAMRRAIRKKANKYGDIQAPLVIALNLGRFHASHEDALQALYGDVQYRIPVGDVAAEPEPSRIRNGVWTGRSGPRCRRVSAVLFSPHISAWSLAARPIRLYPNPWAHQPYEGVLQVFPQAVPVGDLIEQAEGLHPRDVLDLWETWPDDPA